MLSGLYTASVDMHPKEDISIRDGPILSSCTRSRKMHRNQRPIPHVITDRTQATNGHDNYPLYPHSITLCATTSLIKSPTKWNRFYIFKHATQFKPAILKHLIVSGLVARCLH